MELIGVSMAEATTLLGEHSSINAAVTAFLHESVEDAQNYAVEAQARLLEVEKEAELLSSTHAEYTADIAKLEHLHNVLKDLNVSFSS